MVTYDDYVEYLRRLDLVGRLDDAPFKIEKAKDGKVILKEINPIYKQCTGTLVIPQFITDTGFKYYDMGGYLDIIEGEILKDFNFRRIVINNTSDNKVQLKGLCYGIKQTVLDIEIKNPGKIVDTQLMFGCCKNLEIINIRGIDFKGIKEAVGMFYECMSLREIMYDNLSSLKIKNMNFMFCECGSLENINEIYRDLDFQKCEQAAFTFKGCNMLTAINLQLKDFRKLADARFMFSATRVGETDVTVAWASDIYGANETIDFQQLQNAAGMFYDCFMLKQMNTGRFYMPNVVQLSSFVRSCFNLRQLIIDQKYLSSLEDMYGFAGGCNILKTVTVRGDFPKLEITSGMFQGCSELQQITFENCQLSNVEDMADMFKGCYNIMSIDLQQVRLDSATMLNRMFAETSNLRVVKFPDNMKKIQTIDNMFQYSGIREVYFGDMDLNNIVDCFGIFEDASKLTKIVTKLPNISSEQLNMMCIPQCVKDNLKIVCNYKQ